MKKIILSFLTLAMLAQFEAKAQSYKKMDNITTVPPKGWNSWDSYGMYPTQKAMMANLEVMDKKLKPFGYQYFVIDAGWNKMKNDKGKIVSMSLDNYSRYIPNPETFPDGVASVADKAHSMGLKFGIHIMRGISRIAYAKNSPILNTKYTARDIADTTSRCKWNADNYGVDMKKPGAQAYYDSYIALLASWGVDFIKADDITGYPEEIKAVQSAIKKTGRKIVLSLSPGGDAKTEYFKVYKNAELLRITKDIWDDQIGIDRVFEAWKKWSEVDHSGFWLDMDMIPFGHLCTQNPVEDYKNTKQDPKVHGIHQKEHESFFNTDQKYAFMAMRALSASPLFMGGDLPTSDDFTFELLTNTDMLACNENGVTGKLVYDFDGIEVWKVVDKNDTKHGWLGVFNRNTTNKTLDMTAKDLGLKNQRATLWDIWKNKTQGNIAPLSANKMNINAGGVLFCSYKIQ